MTRIHRREFLEDSLLAAAAAAVVPVTTSWRRDTRRRRWEDVIRVAVVGVRGRGRAHVGAFKHSPDAEVVAICDADEGVIARAMKAAPKARYEKDIRKLLEDETIDAVSIATPNHWHSLAAVWALQAGKHVYVEKPISHDVHEGRLVVEAQRRYGKVVMHGTQARSHRATQEAIAWLQAGNLGDVRVARGLCYKRRRSIGKVKGPQQPPATCDYDLWTGPAALLPLMRKNLHYDWHWVFNTGNGDLGNQGVHQMDIARWGLGERRLPGAVASCGGRLGYDDDGETPNTQLALYDYGDRQLLFEVRGLKTAPYKGASIGVVFHCEGGYLVSASYSTVVAFDLHGKPMKTFRGGGDHFQGFLDAVKENDPTAVTAPASEGHLSAALCHLGNVSYRVGESRPLDATDEPFGGAEIANEAFRRMRDHLAGNGLDPASTPCVLGPRLVFDPATERFTGEHAEAANALLFRRPREGYEFPKIQSGARGETGHARR